MRRFFTEPQNITENIAYIFEDAVHITRVLRMNEGDNVILFDGTGYEYTAVLTKIDSHECTAKIIEKQFSKLEPNVKVTIFQGIPKAGKMESIIQKSIELGAYQIIPTVLDRCIAKFDSEKKQNEKLKRWNKIALEAAKQCGRGIVSSVLPQVNLSEAISKMKTMDIGIMPYELLGHRGESSLKSVLQANDFKSIGILIGPEGGFSDAEALLVKDNGIIPVGLGKRILRTETVATAMLAVIMYEKNEM